jgi:methylmalonyl-CoA mutase N-terminal domain/subunit
MAFCADYVPKWNTISISGYHIREAGATALQELAFTLADGFAYVEAGIAAGLDVDKFAPRLSFFFSAHSNFFEEIAKFRAARRIWARHMRERYKAKNPASWMMRFHTQTAGSTLTAQQPENNIIRTAFQALSAVLGQTQSLHTNSMDEALALPTERAAKIALRTQQIIAEELGVAELIDPLAGSYCVESLTQKMEEGAEEYFAAIERQGGMIKAIENGFFRREIARSAYEYQKDIETKRRIIVGVNKYVETTPPQIEILQIDPEIEKEQKENLKKFKESRDNGTVREVLRKLECEASRPFGQRKNLMFPILDCVRAGATLGEICDVFRRAFGEFNEQQMGKGF